MGTNGRAETTGFPRGAHLVLALAGCVIVAFGLWSISGILAPVLLAYTLTLCAQPLRGLLLRHRWHPALATLAVGVSIVVVLLLGGLILILAVSRFVSLIAGLAPQLQQFVGHVREGLQELEVDAVVTRELVPQIQPAELISVVSGLLSWTVGAVFGGLAFFVIVLSMLILMPSDGAHTAAVLAQLSKTRPHLVAAIEQFAHSMRRFMLVTAGLGAVQGALNGAALALMNVPGAFVWAVLSFVCSFIPNIGYFIATAPPLLFGYIAGGWPVLLGVVVLYAVINSSVQTVIQPKIVGHVVNLSQSLTFFSVLLWAVVIGPVGAILAVPLTLFAKAVLVDADPANHIWRPLIGDVQALDGKASQRPEDRQRAHRLRAQRARSGSGAIRSGQKPSRGTEAGNEG